MPRTTARATCSGERVPIPAGAHAGVGEHARVADEAGEDRGHAHARASSSSRSEDAKPRIPNFVADTRCAAQGSCRHRRDEHEVARTALHHPGHQRVRELHGRAQVHVDRAVDLLGAKLSSQPLPGAPRSPEHVHVARALEQPRTSSALIRSAPAPRPRAELGREPASASGRRPLKQQRGAGACSACAIACRSR